KPPMILLRKELRRRAEAVAARSCRLVLSEAVDAWVGRLREERPSERRYVGETSPARSGDLPEPVNAIKPSLRQRLARARSFNGPIQRRQHLLRVERDPHVANLTPAAIGRCAEGLRRPTTARGSLPRRARRVAGAPSCRPGPGFVCDHR